tara:strand:+ start:176 stop:523 length:348 start_codon:yes stop_codon:yes gene_type:complete
VKPGCPALVRAGEGRCRSHERQRQQAYNAHQRPARHAFYGTAKWKKFIAGVKARREKVCVDCRRYSSQLQGDHIISVEARPDLALVEENIALRCRSCHSRRTAKEHGRWGKRPHG